MRRLTGAAAAVAARQPRTKEMVNFMLDAEAAADTAEVDDESYYGALSRFRLRRYRMSGRHREDHPNESWPGPPFYI